MTPSVQAEGPYVVTTWHAAPIPLSSKRAFETLDGDGGARDFVRELFNKGPGDQWGHDHYEDGVGAVDDLPSEGGKVSLPDGTEIEVERTTWRDLAHESDRPDLLKRALAVGQGLDTRHFPQLTAEILAAVNEYYATREGR